MRTSNEKYNIFCQNNRGEDFWDVVLGFCFLEF